MGRAVKLGTGIFLSAVVLACAFSPAVLQLVEVVGTIAAFLFIMGMM